MQTHKNNTTLDQGGESLNLHRDFTQLAIQLAASVSQVNTSPNHQAYWAMREVLPVSITDETKLRRLWLRALDTQIDAKQGGRLMAHMIPGRTQLKRALLERLCVVCRSKGRMTRAEQTYLYKLGRGMKLMPWTIFAVIKRYGAASDPYAILGIDARTSLDTLQRYYRAAVRNLHPDTYLSYGASPHTVAYVTQRLSHINAAYRAIRAEHQVSAT